MGFLTIGNHMMLARPDTITPRFGRVYDFIAIFTEIDSSGAKTPLRFNLAPELPRRFARGPRSSREAGEFSDSYVYARALDGRKLDPHTVELWIFATEGQILAF